MERCRDWRVAAPMWTPRPDQAVKMRALAARFRAQAAETSVEVFRRKFEAAAAELEEAAGRAEAPYRLAS